MEHVILVRHAEPEVNPAQAAAEWSLTDRGILAARRLATVLSGFGPGYIITSPERKAHETAALLAESLDLAVAEDTRLAEQGAGPDEFIPDYGQFRHLVHDHFSQPETVVFRGEASGAAGKRLAACVAGCREHDGEEGVPVLVSHGRIMASWLSQVSGRDPWSIWNDFRLPDLIVVDLAGGTFRSIDVPIIPQGS